MGGLPACPALSSLAPDRRRPVFPSSLTTFVHSPERELLVSDPGAADLAAKPEAIADAFQKGPSKIILPKVGFLKKGWCRSAFSSVRSLWKVNGMGVQWGAGS